MLTVLQHIATRDTYVSLYVWSRLFDVECDLLCVNKVSKAFKNREKSLRVADIYFRLSTFRVISNEAILANTILQVYVRKMPRLTCSLYKYTDALQ